MEPPAEAPRRTPGWVWAVIGALALLQPLSVLLAQYAPPRGAVPTGLHIPDSAIFLQSMRIPERGLVSPYAPGDSGIALCAVPHLWLYAALGRIAEALPSAHLTVYAWANGLGAAVYLYAVYRLILALAPSIAGSAFLLYALSGGPGGLLYLLTAALGLHDHPRFELYFTRFALYDLMEGPHLNPALYTARLYYTLSLAGCFAAWRILIPRTVPPAPAGARASRPRIGLSETPRTAARRVANPALACAVLLPAAFLNARFGLFALGAVTLCLLHSAASPTERLRRFLPFAACVLAGTAASAALMRQNPAVIDNHLQVASMAMWLSPFIATAWLHLLLSARPVCAALRALPPFTRAAACAALGYLAAYALGYLLYQGYYGNLLTGRDGTVAPAISDWSLLGALAGLAAARFVKQHEESGEQAADSPPAWIALLFLLFLAAAISAWGGGWFLRFGPQRMQVFLWLPLCILAAAGLHTLKPRPRACALALLLGCGVLSIAVSTLAFQGPLGRTDACGPFAAQHAEVMSAHDAVLIAAVGEGTLLAPAPISDIAALKRGINVVFGIGSFNLTREPFVRLRAGTERFFAPATPHEERREMLKSRAVQQVLCPDTWPVDPQTIAALRTAPFLREITASGRGVLFEVQQ